MFASGQASDDPTSAPLPARWAVAVVALGTLLGFLWFSDHVRAEAALEEGPLLRHVAAPAATGLHALANATGLSALTARSAAFREALYEDDTRWAALAAPPDQPPAPEPLPAWVDRQELEDDTDARQETPDTADAASAASPELAIAQAPPPRAPRRILMVGASSMQFELGREIERRFQELGGLELRRFGRHSTGLTRPDYFDWIEKAEELADTFRPELVIAQFGGNDCQGMTHKDGRVAAQYSERERWDQLYAERVEAFLDVFAERGADVVMVGMPTMRAPSFRRRVQNLNRVIASVCERRDVPFFSLDPITADSRGQYREVGEVRGRQRPLRADDGIHLSVHGAILVSDMLLAFLRERYTLPDAPNP